MKLKKLLSTLLFVLMLMSTAQMSLMNASAASEIEYALFPMNTLRIVRTNIALDSQQKRFADPAGGHVKYAWDLSGNDTKVKAPFTGTIVKIDKGNEHLVILQSKNEIKLANGAKKYLTCAFVHDDDISNLYVGKEVKQGEYFYDQGTFGKGKKGTYDAHLHLEIAIGRWKTLSEIRNSTVGIQVNDALYLKSSTTRNRDYIEVNGKRKNLTWRVLSEVTFNANGGVVSQTKQLYLVNGQFGSLPTPTRKGYVFTGWYTQRSGGSEITTATKVSSGNKTYYAQWIQKDISKSIVTTKNVGLTDKNINVADLVTVKLWKSTLKYNVDYTLSPSTVKTIGRYTVTIKGKGDYIKEKKVTIEVQPKTPALKSVRCISVNSMDFARNFPKIQRDLTKPYILEIRCAPVNDCDKQEIQISKTSDFKAAYSITVDNYKKDAINKYVKPDMFYGVMTIALNGTKENINVRTTYYVRVRALKKVNGNTIYGNWGVVRNSIAN